VGPSGWIGIWLDGTVDWAELADLLRDSYLLVAPKKLGLQLREEEPRPRKEEPKTRKAAQKRRAR
jgi:hypothetical protein